MTTTKYERARLISGSMGSEFDAPNYPSHTHSVETDLSRKPENRGGMNIDYALKCDYISPSLKAKITKLIANWNATKPAINSPEFKEWVNDCTRHWGSLSSALPHIQKFYPKYS